MKNLFKSILILVLFTITFVPIVLFIVYPLYTDVYIEISSLDLYKISNRTSIKLLTAIAPKEDIYKEEVLGASTIEESINPTTLKIDKSKIEDINTVLQIETLDISGNIYQGESSITMDLGFWHYPTSSYPGKKGNVVIVGHRFGKIPPATDTFYNLDKIQIGDKITITNDYSTYNYIVVNIKEAEANDMSVVDQTRDYRLTLITCTPLWTSEKRLVVTAMLDKLYKKV